MDWQEQNWKNFCANHIEDWHGIWTRYSPERDITESFRSLRSFQSNSEQTEICQTNRYTYADGRTQEQSWEFNKQSNNLPDGMFHPQRASMRGYFLEQGAATWAEKKIGKGSPFGIELFFRYEHLRHSVGIIYSEAGTLSRTGSIREDSTGFPSQHWSTEINQLPEQNLSGNWAGTSVAIGFDLQISSPVSTQLQWPIPGNETFFFPDGISLSCPNQINMGSPSFAITANWLVTPSHLQQLTIKYDDSGSFSTLTLALLQI